MKRSNKFPSSLPEVGRAGSLCEVRVGLCPGVGPEGMAWVFCPPLCGIECRGHAQYPTFASDTGFCSWLFRSGSWSSWSFCIFFVHNLPQLCYFWSHIVSLYFVAEGDVCEVFSFVCSVLRKPLLFC